MIILFQILNLCFFEHRRSRLLLGSNIVQIQLSKRTTPCLCVYDHRAVAEMQLLRLYSESLTLFWEWAPPCPVVSLKHREGVLGYKIRRYTCTYTYMHINAGGLKQPPPILSAVVRFIKGKAFYVLEKKGHV